MGRFPLFLSFRTLRGVSLGYTLPNELRDASVRESLAELLSELGYEVIACENGEEAVKIYQEQGPFDIAILDYTVPGKWNGIEVLRELKKVNPEVKAILATGYGQTETVVLAKQEGFKEVLVKPFEVEELLRALKASLS
jgi:DNA-binding NtrC family response regulator